MPSLQGKIEFEAMEDGQEDKIMEKLFTDAVKSVFERFFEASDVESIALQFAEGLHATTGESIPSEEYAVIIKRIEGLDQAIHKIDGGDNLAVQASVAEFILEGLHIKQLLNKDRVGGRTTYRA